MATCKTWIGQVFVILVLSLGLGLTPVFAASNHEGHDSASDRPAWLDKLENQINYEEMMEGMDGRQEKLDKTFMALMDNLKNKLKEHVSPASAGGGFHDSWATHQLQQGFLLGPTEAADQVFRGAHCPAGVPTKVYNISAINVEITLNQWGDYYPGYMYELDENIDQVRAEEDKNAKAREEGLDPGAVSTGIQGDTIQPVLLRGNQGDCVRFKVTNLVEDEDVGFQINGSAMIISGSGLPVTAVSKDAIIPAEGMQNFEWYIPIDEQEGGHMIVSRAGRDPAALGLVGSFIVGQRGVK